MQDAETVFTSLESTKLPSSKDWIDGTKYSVVIVEDILSAIRVGRHVRSVSLLGTSASAKTLLHEVSIARAMGKLIAVWLDADKAGKVGTNRIRNQLELLGSEPVCIRTTKDPKRYTNQEIKEILSAGLEPPSANQEPEGLL